MPQEESIKWVVCASCGHQAKKHRVLYEKTITVYDDEPPEPPIGEVYHRLAECMGCESIKYVVSNSSFDDPGETGETNVEVYPDAPGRGQQRVALISQDDATDDDGKLLIPVSVWKMYKETIDALNANIRTLAGGGLRATVEAICLGNQIMQENLQAKIDELVKRGLLTAAQAELLHEERYLGNAALHELETPSAQDIEDGLR